ncbi:hypothetical protein BDA99DRAFT_538328 [Phascolomyces articulosus]|uniref:Zn(2)-C6 fungal-type domain-containing protein n=1 Tax=Phascolomyces articulosus TaxID=60185 RepID=A0AAD5KBW8_9FUNG|nr:hypothetical protein BDA99DRAFT_538328 [Phascolomyces articulosus]
MRNPKPCKVCRLRRKKCVWSCNNNSNQICDRCSKLNIDCIPQSDSSDEQLDEGVELMAQDGDQELQRMLDDMNQLNNEMQLLDSTKANLEQLLSLVNTTAAVNEQQLQQYRSPSLSWSSSPSLSSLSPYMSPSSSSTITTVSSKKAVVPQQEEANTEWQLSIVNGSIRLETPIRTIDELTMFTQASLRYLSPFTGLFKQEPVRFEATCISPSLGLATVLQRSVVCRPRKKQRFALINYHKNNQVQPFNYRAIMDYLLPLYFEHYNSMVGMLHAPTFWKHYHSLDDPLECPITLAATIDATVSLRNLIDLTPIQRRLIGDYLYSKCKDILFELYEDPDRKLEIVTTTCLLQTYLTDVLLNAVEARRLLSVALLLCSELSPIADKFPTIDRILFQRHHVIMEVNQRAFNMLFEDKIDFAIPGGMLNMQPLDDEPEKTKMYINLYNHIFRLLGCPYISTIMGQINAIFYGEPCELYLEDILQYEPIVRDWWDSLPPDLRICEDPFDPEGYKLVENKVSSKLLFPYAAMNLLTAVMTSSVLRPQYTPSSENAITIDVMHAVRQKLISLALNSSRVLIHSLQANWLEDTCDTPAFSLCVIIHVLYCLEKLGHCADIPFPNQLLIMIKKNFERRRLSLLPADHVVPPSDSLLTSLLENPDQPLMDLYEQYPLPGYAMLSDVLGTSFNQLDHHLSATL